MGEEITKEQDSGSGPMGLRHADVCLERIAEARARLARRRWSRRRFRDAIRGEARRAPHQRVVPLPLTLAAVALPFIAAWATGAPPDDGAPTPDALAWTRGAQGAAESLLDRGRREPDPGAGYVDLWAAPAPWEARAVASRGYVFPGAADR